MILIVNSGSSSLKLAFFSQYSCQCRSVFENPVDAESIKQWLDRKKIKAVGHRVVHGGIKYTVPTELTFDVIQDLKTLESLAPLHQSEALKWINFFQGYPSYACFDTAFHHTLQHKRFPIAREFYDQGVLRYGFHGISYQSLMRQMKEKHPDLADKKIIACHLGSGSSLCAIDKGKSVATTMGFTPLDGLMMGTRCGRLDPGVVFYLLSFYSLEDLQHLLSKKSGLLGVSELSADMRVLEKSSDPYAQEAVKLYCDSIVQEMHGLIGLLGGIDVLIFSGGIGENSFYVRNYVAQKLLFSNVSVFVLATQEEEEIARSYEQVVWRSGFD